MSVHSCFCASSKCARVCFCITGQPSASAQPKAGQAQNPTVLAIIISSLNERHSRELEVEEVDVGILLDKI